jgi:hypothetical protein
MMGRRSFGDGGAPKGACAMYISHLGLEARKGELSSRSKRLVHGRADAPARR